jgi:hypothetical protein
MRHSRQNRHSFHRKPKPSEGTPIVKTPAEIAAYEQRCQEAQAKDVRCGLNLSKNDRAALKKHRRVEKIVDVYLQTVKAPLDGYVLVSLYGEIAGVRELRCKEGWTPEVAQEFMRLQKGLIKKVEAYFAPLKSEAARTLLTGNAAPTDFEVEAALQRLSHFIAQSKTDYAMSKHMKRHSHGKRVYASLGTVFSLLSRYKRTKNLPGEELAQNKEM